MISQSMIEKLVHLLAKTNHTIRMYEDFEEVGQVLVNDAGGILDCTDDIVQLLAEMKHESPQIEAMVNRIDQEARKKVYHD